MYFADHGGSKIFVATASSVTGTWTPQSYTPLALTDFPADTWLDHMASPDIHLLDNTDDGQKLQMYFHSVYKGAGKQWSGVADSTTDGLDFTPYVNGLQWDDIIGRFYFRVWEWRGKYYTYAKFFKEGPGELWESKSPLGPFYKIKDIFLTDTRHVAVLRKGDVLIIFKTTTGDAPEHIEMVTMDLNGDPSTWETSTVKHILYPEMSYEGIAYPIAPSVDGSAINVRQLRDPCLFEDGGNTYLFYTGEGEEYMCGATLSYTWGTAPSTVYTLTVNSGEGDGTYKSGDSVVITAKAPPSGKVFSAWTGSTQYLADSTAEKTTLTMPSSSITVTATYANTSDTLYHLVVHDGLGEGWYPEGADVTISALPAPSGMVFDRWVGRDTDQGFVVNPTASTTVVNMPAQNVTIAAGYWDNQPTQQAFEQKSDSNNVLVMEAEHFDQNISRSAHNWVTTTSPTGYSGASGMVTTPNNGLWTKNYVTDSPEMVYRVYFRQTGRHFINIRRCDYGINDDNFIQVGINGRPISSYDMAAARNVAWNWAGVDRYELRAWINVDHAGLNKINIWMGHDGAAIDKIVIHTVPTYNPSSTGPAESPRIGPGTVPVTYTLTVNSGSGDGNYSYGTNVSINANTPPSGQVFDHWTGDTSTVANAAAPSTSLTMPAANITVTALYKNAPAGSENAFLEEDGYVTFEAEHETGSQAGTGAGASYTWVETTPYTGASNNTVMLASPNNGGNMLDTTDGPRLDYKIYFQTPGTYYMLVRIPYVAGGDNSVQVGADGSLITANVENTAGTVGTYIWKKAAGTMSVASPGVKTFNMWMREDGTPADKIVITNDAGYAPIGTDPGPSESPQMPGGTTYTLTVNSGSGDGSYTQGAVVAISANAPGGGEMFDQWTGSTQYVADVYAANTTVTMPASNITVTATYTSEVTYTLTVTSGTGDGSYTAGTIVAITADAPGTGKIFDKWTGDTAYVANVNTSTTSVTMPAANVSVTATYSNVYTLTVNSGSGDGSYTQGTVVNIAASAPQPGYAFDHWTGDTAYVANVNSSATTITMQAANATVTALYESTSGIDVVTSGTPDAVILTRPSPTAVITKAAQELQWHIKKMSGATLPIDVVGSEGSYSGYVKIYLGQSTATDSAGINVSALTVENFQLLTSGGNIYIVGRDGGNDTWSDVYGCRPGNLNAVYYVLGEALGCRWLWPGEIGTYVPTSSTVTIPNLNITSGPDIEMRKLRHPRASAYTGTHYQWVPIVPASQATKDAIIEQERLWMRRHMLGDRMSASFHHSESDWWELYGASHPEYFAVLLTGKTQPYPSSDMAKINVSLPAAQQQKVDEWQAAGASKYMSCGNSDGRGFCVCANCLAWDDPSQAPELTCDNSAARLQDRYAKWYKEVSERAQLVRSDVILAAYAYDVYRYAPNSTTIPSNIWIGYIHQAPTDADLTAQAAAADDIDGWLAAGASKVYIRPNWTFSGHIGPYWPLHRVGNHFKSYLDQDYVVGADFDGPCSNFTGYGIYYYLAARQMAKPGITVDQAMAEFCQGFGDASTAVDNYLDYWETFINGQADAGNSDILGWATCVPAYSDTYTASAFNSAEAYLNSAYNALDPADTWEEARVDFMYAACTHGRKTALAIGSVDPGTPITSNPTAEGYLRDLLDYRNDNAADHKFWREYFIWREADIVPGMHDYWTYVLSSDPTGDSSAGAFIENSGRVVMEAENYTVKYQGTGAAASCAWEENLTVNGASGSSVMEVVPNSGVNTGDDIDGPRMDYKIHFYNTGRYYVHVRMPSLGGGDNSIQTGANGILRFTNADNTFGAWKWVTWDGGDNPMYIGISSPGVYYFNIWMREDGVQADKIVLTTDPDYTIAGDSTGPAESPIETGTLYTLTVNSGTGDGLYPSGYVAEISADDPPTGKIFDHWTGDTAAVANVNSVDTTITMPAANRTVTAVYSDGTTYSLTVNSGTGDGSYIQGYVAQIVADAPGQNQTFDKWTGDTQYVANVNSSTTTVTMPAAAVTVTASYKTAYTLTVNSGSGDGTYEPGTVAPISADSPGGYQFYRWTGDTAYVANVNSADTTVTMPSANVTVTATYNQLYTLTVTSGSGDGSYIQGTQVQISAEAPQSGQQFDQWTGDVAYVANVNSGVTTVTMPAANVSVTATYSGATGSFIEEAGFVCMEAEHYTSSAAGTGACAGKEWDEVQVTGDVGSTMQALPNTGVSAGDGSTAGCRMDFSVNFSTTGVYYALLRMPYMLGADNSVNVGMDGSITSSNQGHTNGDWRWKKVATGITVSSTGYHTYNIWMREDGTPVDRIVLTTNNSYTIGDADTGPAESGRESGQTFTLTVNSGSGDGDYAQGTQVGVTADAPGGSQEFDQWTGDVAYVANALSSSTTVTMPAADVAITATYANLYALTVTSGSGDGSYRAGTVLGITADAPGQNQVFDKWTGDTAYVANVNSASTTVTMPAAAISVTATYITSYTLTVTSGSGDGSYYAGHVVNITADAPAAGKQFQAWTGDVAYVANVNSASTTATMPAANVSVTATYSNVYYTLTVNSGSGDGSYIMGAQAAIAADTAPVGYEFDQWTGNTSHLANPYSANTTVTMPAGNVTVTATYRLRQYTLAVVSGSGDGQYTMNTVVNIVADAPESGYEFDKWTGDGVYVADIYASTTTVTMPAASLTLTATYKPITAYGAFLEAGGLVSMEAEHFTSEAAGTGAYSGHSWDEVTDVVDDSGTSMQALPNSSANAGDGSTAGPRMDFNVKFVTTGVYYIRVRQPYRSGADNSLNYGMDNSLVGSSLGADALDWRWAGKPTYPITVSSAGYHTLNIWMREDGMIADKIVLTTDPDFNPLGSDLGPAESAQEAAPTYDLVVNYGSGDGSYEQNDVITITANAPALGKQFDEWTGDVAYVANVNSSTTTVTMPAQNISVTATYSDILYSLTVTSGSGDGSYIMGAQQQIVADSPQGGYVFDQWTGDVANVANVNASTTTVTMPAGNVSVTATYEPLYTLTVTSGSGDGSYIQGAVVNIQADAPPQGYTFNGWTGGTQYLANPSVSSTTVTMPAGNVSITATYTPSATYTLTVVSGSGDGTYSQGNTPQIVADAAPGGKVFDKWTGDTDHVANVNSSTTTVTIPDHDVTVTATYKDIEGAFQEASGMVVFEAENYTGIAAGTGAAAGHEWELNDSTSGASNTDVMEALPDATIVNVNDTSGPRLDFKVNFSTTGTYYCWIRMPALGAKLDTVYDGLNSSGQSGTDIIQNSSGAWAWVGSNSVGTRNTVTISSTGEHTYNIWMRENGVKVDKLLLTTNSSYTPTSTGPAESDFE
jgi:uncharacterized repeat protein (TIGR02543 family)